MGKRKVVRVSLYNGVFRVDELPAGVELRLTDADESACNDKTYPGGVRRTKYHADPRGSIVERTWQKSEG
jgi:hypothetical protein